MAKRPHHWGAIMALAMATAGPSQLLAQLAPPSTGGITALEEALRPLGVYKRLLIIGAHPDDEDTELLTLAVRKHGAAAAYLSLNRGEGGQNLIGPELGEGLGLIRTEELLAARRIDGARQFFTRAYDFGYSKSIEDTWRHWPRDSILKDVVRIVRGSFAGSGPRLLFRCSAEHLQMATGSTRQRAGRLTRRSAWPATRRCFRNCLRRRACVPGPR